MQKAAEDDKSLGRYYTPARLVNYILDAVGYRSSATIEPLRLLDPSCGDGAFLCEAASRLMTRCVSLGMSRVDILNRLRANISGIDVDPRAIESARARLRQNCIDHLGKEQIPDTFGDMIHLSNALTAQGQQPVEGSFDVVVGNPPFVGVKSLEHRTKHFLRKTYSEVTSEQFDLCGLFLYRYLQLVHPGGGFGFILPLPLFLNLNMSEVRHHLLSNMSVSELTILEPGRFFPASVEPVILIATKKTSKYAACSSTIWIRRGLEDCSPLQVPQAAYLHSAHRTINPHADRKALSILDKIQVDYVPLGAFFKINRGVECGKSHPALRREPDGDTRPLLRGEDLKPWGFAWANTYIDLQRIEPNKVKNLRTYEAPKLMVNRVGALPKCAFDEKGYFTLNTVYNLRLKSREPLDLLTVYILLNSELMQFYFHLFLVKKERLFPYVRTYQLEAIPVSRKLIKNQSALLRLLPSTLEKATTDGRLIDELNQAIYEAYSLDNKDIEQIKRHLSELKGAVRKGRKAVAMGEPPASVTKPALAAVDSHPLPLP